MKPLASEEDRSQNQLRLVGSRWCGLFDFCSQILRNPFLRNLQAIPGVGGKLLESQAAASPPPAKPSSPKQSPKASHKQSSESKGLYYDSILLLYNIGIMKNKLEKQLKILKKVVLLGYNTTNDDGGHSSDRKSAATARELSP